MIELVTTAYPPISTDQRILLEGGQQAHPPGMPRVHELSIAKNIVEVALEALGGVSFSGAEPTRVVAEVRLRLGALAGVQKDSLLFCYGVVTEATPLAGSRLVIEEEAVVIYCPHCQTEQQLNSIQSFLCPACGHPSGDVRRGRELELLSIELAEASNAPGDS